MMKPTVKQVNILINVKGHNLIHVGHSGDKHKLLRYMVLYTVFICVIDNLEMFSFFNDHLAHILYHNL